MTKKSLLAAALVSSVAAFAPNASAVESYPIVIRGTLKLGYDPPCRLCHLQGTTGSGTLETPFAFAMRARGLTGESSATLVTALDRMRTEKVDSDGDGVTDIDELVAGSDPNSPAPGARLTDEPDHGCAMGRGSSSGLGLIAVAIALFAMRRREASLRDTVGLQIPPG